MAMAAFGIESLSNAGWSYTLNDETDELLKTIETICFWQKEAICMYGMQTIVRHTKRRYRSHAKESHIVTRYKALLGSSIMEIF